MNFIISTDSCVDELKENLLHDDVHVIPMTFISGDETFKDDFSSIDEYEQFYSQLSQGKIFKTSSLNSAEVEEFFRDLLGQEKDIIHISLSSGLSVTYDIIKEVAEKLNAKSKNKIYVLESLSATQGQNLLVKLAADFRDKDFVAHEAFEKLNNALKHLDVTFFVTDFDCLKRGGRVSGVQALIGKFAGIRPVLDFDLSGKLRVVQKVIGNKKAISVLAERLDNYDSDFNFRFFIAHTGNQDAVNELEKYILDKFANASITKNYIGPTIGAHTGAGALGLVFLGKSERV